MGDMGGRAIKKRVPDAFLPAFKCGHRKIVREFIDDEFSHELYQRYLDGDKKAGEALAWIAKYNNEYYKGFLKKNDPQAIHNTPKLYKEATDSQNARRRDILGAIKSGLMGNATIIQAEDNPTLVDDFLTKAQALHEFEDTIIDLVARKINFG